MRKLLIIDVHFLLSLCGVFIQNIPLYVDVDIYIIFNVTVIALHGPLKQLHLSEERVVYDSAKFIHTTSFFEIYAYRSICRVKTCFSHLFVYLKVHYRLRQFL